MKVPTATAGWCRRSPPDCRPVTNTQTRADHDEHTLTYQQIGTRPEAHHAGRLQAELIRLGRYPLIVINEVGYIPFEAEAANLFFQLVSARYERASLIVTSNKPRFGGARPSATKSSPPR